MIKQSSPTHCFFVLIPSFKGLNAIDFLLRSFRSYPFSRYSISSNSCDFCDFSIYAVPSWIMKAELQYTPSQIIIMPGKNSLNFIAFLINFLCFYDMKEKPLIVYCKVSSLSVASLSSFIFYQKVYKRQLKQYLHSLSLQLLLFLKWRGRFDVQLQGHV